MEKSKNISFKIIAAGITLLLGIILAIGYPTGGVKVSNVHKRNVVRQTTTTTHKVNTQTTKKTETKKRFNPPVAPPSSSDNSGDEGC